MDVKAVIFSCLLFFIQFLVVQNEEPPIPKYSTKTSYDLSFNGNDIFRRDLSWKELEQETAQELHSCIPLGVYVVYRHGTRYPSEKDMNKFNSFLEKIRVNNINPEFEYLRNEKKMQVNLQRTLSETGKVEINHLAGRLKKRFPELFPGRIHLNDYEFQSTNLSRTIDSTLAFIQGFVGTDTNCSSSPSTDELSVSCENSSSEEVVIVPFENKTADYLLRFFDVYEDCLKDQDEEDGDKEREDGKFVEGKEVGEMQQRLARKLSVPGASEMFNISRDEAIELAKLCGYQLALFNHFSWCSLLTPEDLSVFEYKQDLKHYWKRGYGHPVNYLVGCNLAQDVIKYLEQLTNEQENIPKGIFKFAHAETVVPLQCLLSLFKDKHPLLATDYQKNQLRNFRTSWMAPFSANVAFALFKCPSEEGHSKDCGDQKEEFCSQKGQGDYKLQVFLNELPVDLPFCKNTFCDLEDFSSYIKQTIGKCNFNNTCCIEDCEGSQLSGWAIFGITVAVLGFFAVFCSGC